MIGPAGTKRGESIPNEMSREYEVILTFPVQVFALICLTIEALGVQRLQLETEESCSMSSSETRLPRFEEMRWQITGKKALTYGHEWREVFSAY